MHRVNPPTFFIPTPSPSDLLSKCQLPSLRTPFTQSQQPMANDEEELLIPPDNFAMVEPGIYRAGFPGKKNFSFLKTLNLRTILYLCPEDYPEANLTFLTGIHVQLLQFGVAGNKEPFMEIPHGVISEALVQILDTRNHPLLIHCNKGKHRTGCMVGVLRKVLGWSLSSIFEEYRVFSAPKERFVDQQFIECWEMTLPETHTMHPARHARNTNNSNGNTPTSADSNSLDSSLAPAITDEKAAYLLNPEANDHLHKKEQKKEAAIREQPATTTNAALQAATIAALPLALAPARPLSHHQHTQSQPNLARAVRNDTSN